MLGCHKQVIHVATFLAPLAESYSDLKDRYAMVLKFVFTLERQINRALPLLVHIELTLRHLRYHLTDVPPQPNSPPDYVFRTDQPSKKTTLNPKLAVMQVSV